MEEKEYLTKEELARKINMSVKFIEDNTHLRKVPGAIKIGRYWRYRKADIEKALLSGTFLIERAPQKPAYSRKVIVRGAAK